MSADAYDAYGAYDPTAVASQPANFFTEVETDLEELLRNELQIAATLQMRIKGLPHTVDPRELKDLISAHNTLVANSHRHHELLQELSTYRLFVDTTVAFIKQRSDALGEDLLSQLVEVASSMRAADPVKALVASSLRTQA